MPSQKKKVATRQDINLKTKLSLQVMIVAAFATIFTIGYQLALLINQSKPGGNTQDTQAPVITNIRDYPDPVNQNEQLIISANITDNVGVFRARLEVDNSRTYNMDNRGGGIFRTSTVDTSDSGTHTYKIIAVDRAGNRAITPEYSFTVQESQNLIPGRIEAEDFKEGANGVAYLEVSEGDGEGGNCRPDTWGVDTKQNINVEDGSCRIGFFEPTEWLAYDVNIGIPGTYNLTARVSRDDVDDTSFTVLLNNATTLGEVIVPDTGSWNNFTTTIPVEVILPAGQHEIKIVRGDDWLDINWFRFEIADPIGGCGADCVEINPGENIQAAVDRNSDGTEFLLKEGVHRYGGSVAGHHVVPKLGNTFRGERSDNGELISILSGARVLDNFVQESTNIWYAPNQMQEPPVPRGNDWCNWPYNCGKPNDLWINGEVKNHALDLGSVTGTDWWYFDYSRDRVYVYMDTGDNPNNYFIETSVADSAFWADNGIWNVTIEDLIIEKYAQTYQYGAIQIGGWEVPVPYNWTVENNEVRDNHGIGISPVGNDSLIINNYVHHNGQLGIGNEGDDTLIEGNEVSYNNYKNWFFSAWASGGIKMHNQLNLTLRGNYVHNNTGAGLWDDVGGRYFIYENNLVENNYDAGIFHETSYDAIIRNNTVRRNGFGFPVWFWSPGILIAASENVEVHDNCIEDNFNAIMGMQQFRYTDVNWNYEYDPGIDTLHEIHNLNVHDNEIYLNSNFGYWQRVGMKDARTGGPYPEQDYNPDDLYLNSNNTFQNNTYYQGLHPQPFHWWNAPGSEGDMDFSGWQSQGQDVNGQFLTPDTGCPFDEAAWRAIYR